MHAHACLFSIVFNSCLMYDGQGKLGDRFSQIQASCLIIAATHRAQFPGMTD
jgi:hypothetical protein